MELIPLMQKGFASNSSRIAKITEQFQPQEAYFRPYNHVNHLAWELGHLAFVRNTIIKLLDSSAKLESFDHERTLFSPGASLMPEEMYPTLEALIEVFNQRGERIVALLNTLTQEHWDSQSPFQLPFGNTVGIQIWAFFLHESTHLGEISYLKNIVIRQRN